MKIKMFLAVGIILILALVGLAGCNASAADNSPINVNVGSQQTGIWVSGEGKVTVTPDIALIYLGVSAKADKVADAQAQAAVAMDRVMSALTGSGIDKKDIQTQYYSIDQLTRYDNVTQEAVITGYQVSNTVTVKIRAVDNTGPIIDAVAAAGGDNTRINGISFSVDDPAQYYAQARSLAIKDAQATAENMAKLTGVTLGRVTYISESNYSQPVPIYASKSMDTAGSGATTSISAGEMDITLNVQVAYALQ